MKILVVKHLECEGPGTLGDYLENSGFELETIECEHGDALPKDMSGYTAMISMGGDMNVDDEEEFPFLKQEDVLIKEVIEKNIPFLGICLGAQLLAKAAGAKVVKSPVQEIGWFDIELKKDSIFEGAATTCEVFQLHGDMFEIPKEGELIATAKGCPNQALKVGKNAYGFQFHIEVTPDMIDLWFKGKRSDFVDYLKNNLDDYNKRAETIYKNFVKIIKEAL